MFEAPAAGTTTAANQITQTVPQGWHAQHPNLIARELTAAAVVNPHGVSSTVGVSFELLPNLNRARNFAFSAVPTSRVRDDLGPLRGERCEWGCGYSPSVGAIDFVKAAAT